MSTTYDVYDAQRLDGVRRKRIFAFLMDFTAVLLLSFGAGIIVFFLGIVTLGLAWGLYGAIIPIVAVFYSGFSIAGSSATPGMRAMGLVFRTESGAPPNFLQGGVHVILFYLTATFLTPLVLLVSLFNSRKRLLHDMLIGATVENV
ncbi:RDD family protein [Terrihabitans sp. B22-R8]|uniref:RDD family protein n=1 Tax=Terrihabitans sp. B22-R8 TaxID=3425128 RepID=UPI00403C622A